MPRPTHACLPTLLLSAALSAQTLDQIREELRQSAGNARLSGLMAGLVDLAENDLVSSATMRIHGDPHLDLTTYKLPFHTAVSLGPDAPELHLEGGLAYFTADAFFPDIWTGGLPGLETGIDSRWNGIGGALGAGPRFDLGHDLHLTAVADGSLAYIENDVDYSGPGAAVTTAVLDGILFGWHATTAAYGAALRLEHDLDFGGERSLASVLRYDVRRFDVVRSTDPAQDSADTINRVTARTEYGSPTGWTVLDRPLRWSAHVGVTAFLGRGRDNVGFSEYLEVGGGLSAPLRLDALPFDQLTLSGSILYGEDLRGFSFGAGVTF